MRISDWSSDVCSSDLLVGPAQPLEIARVGLSDGMADRLEIIDQHIIVDVQLFANQRRADDPWIVGEADDLALRRPSYGDRDAARPAPALPALEILPCGLEADRQSVVSGKSVSVGVNLGGRP